MRDQHAWQYMPESKVTLWKTHKSYSEACSMSVAGSSSKCVAQRVIWADCVLRDVLLQSHLEHTVECAVVVCLNRSHCAFFTRAFPLSWLHMRLSLTRLGPRAMPPSPDGQHLNALHSTKPPNKTKKGAPTSSRRRAHSVRRASFSTVWLCSTARRRSSHSRAASSCARRLSACT